MPPGRLAIDAANLARDRRGLGRIVRPVVAAASRDERFRVTLLADRAADRQALHEAFPALEVRPSRSAWRAGVYDTVWFPFNGMRYATAAPALVSIADAFAFTEPHAGLVARFREQAPVRRAARTAARVVTISQWSRAEIERALRVPGDRVSVVAPAPDAFWTPGRDDGLPPELTGRRFALLVGAREPRKNARLALEACALALAPEERLAIVGRLGPGDRARALALGVPCGEIDASDAMLRSLYRSAAAVLVPSLAEGFGLVALEAMACGTPVLASEAAALPEATGGAVPLLDPQDAPLWARAIRRTFDDEPYAADARSRGLAYVARIDRAAPVRAMLALLGELARGCGGT